MLRVLVLVLIVTAAAFGLAQFADAPGSLVITWLGYRIETSVLVGALGVLTLVVLLLFLWSVLRFVITRPVAMRRSLHRRRRERGIEALSQGMIAIGAGDRERAQRYAAIAKKALPDEPLTDVLRGQAAQLGGDRATARKIFESMTERPATELFGLHGLFLEAKRENELEAARQFAQRAVRRNPKVSWSVNALFELQCRVGDWTGALRTLAVARDHKQVDRDMATRRCAVLLTAQAKEAEASDVDRARELALEAHKLAPDLVPAADIAGRLLAAQGHTMRASRLIAKSWKLSPHPDLAMAYAHARPGDSPRERLRRVKLLTQSTPASVEGPIAVATEAVEARDWASAREALQPLLGDRPTARVCTLMARVEGGESGDSGRVREWLARAVRAPRDPAWTADGAVSDQWAPISPVTGALDAFAWRVPVEVLGAEEDKAKQLLQSLESGQRDLAVVQHVAYRDILSFVDQRARLVNEPPGLAAAELTDEQYQALRSLVHEYAANGSAAITKGRMDRFDGTARENVHFAWAGGTMPGEGVYYRVQTPDFLVEYANTQNRANHSHTVWRDWNGDFGHDVRAAHYQDYDHGLGEPVYRAAK